MKIEFRNTFVFPNVQLNRNCEINIEETVVLPPSVKTTKDGDNLQSQDQKLWEGDSQFELLDSQQLAEGLALCDEFLLSQSQTSCGGGDEPRETKPCLAAYAHLSAEDFKKRWRAKTTAVSGGEDEEEVAGRSRMV